MRNLEDVLKRIEDLAINLWDVSHAVDMCKDWTVGDRLWLAELEAEAQMATKSLMRRLVEIRQVLRDRDA